MRSQARQRRAAHRPAHRARRRRVGDRLCRARLALVFLYVRHGKKLPSLTKDRQRLELGRPDLQTLVAAFDGPDLELDRLAAAMCRRAMAGVLQSAGGAGRACRRVALAPTDRTGPPGAERGKPRLCRRPPAAAAHRLVLEPRGDFDEALRCLEPLYDRSRETTRRRRACWPASINAAGWRPENRQEWLQKAFDSISRGWEGSKKASFYLGVNAATTALWLGSGPESRRIAAEVVQRLLDRSSKLARFRANRDLAMNYWDHATLAEAQLLLGQWEPVAPHLPRRLSPVCRPGGRRPREPPASRRGANALGTSAEAAESFFG